MARIEPRTAPRLWKCAACGNRWASRLKRPPVCPVCFERHHDEPAYLKERRERRAEGGVA